MPDSTRARTQRGRWTWRIATLTGIPVRIHFTLVLLLVWIAWMELQAASKASPTGSWTSEEVLLAVAGRMLFVVGLFVSVLLHELGHALVARRQGTPTSEIVLYPFGGVSRLEGLGSSRQEFWTSLAGPSVNLVIAIGIYAGLQATGHWVAPEKLIQGDLNLLERLMAANVVLALFNLVPAFPMDGGRVLRALLARRLGMVRGTVVASSIGQALAILLGLAGLIMGNFILMFIAFFVFISASQEVIVQRSIALMQGQRVRDAMVTRFETLAHADTLGQAADLLLASSQHDFPVVAGSDVVGLLTRADLVRGLADHGPRAYVAGSARREFIRLRPEQDLHEALDQVQASSDRVGLVFEGEKLVGLLTEENVGEFFQVHAAEGGGTGSIS
jgi:Zn-dependent protease/CBS domain-containing protein